MCRRVIMSPLVDDPIQNIMQIKKQITGKQYDLVK